MVIPVEILAGPENFTVSCIVAETFTDLGALGAGFLSQGM
jgi:hypothetical protein